MLTDLKVIGERVRGRDGVFSMRIVLTALIKGDQETRESILARVKHEDFVLSDFKLIFEWISHSIASTGTVEEEILDQRMAARVAEIHRDSQNDPRYDHSYEQILPGHLALIEHLYLIDLPEKSLVDDALAVLRRKRDQRH